VRRRYPTEKKPKSLDDLSRELKTLRAQLEPAFGPETAIPGTKGTVPSAGHCAVVAAIIHDKLGGTFVSAMVSGISHWFNRFVIDGHIVDVDITGDQFGHQPIRIESMGQLFPGTRERKPTELNEETRQRSADLAARAGIVASAKTS
jgi:hypothetical protein